MAELATGKIHYGSRSASAIRQGQRLSPAQRIEIDFAKLRQEHRLFKLSCRRIPGARERQGPRMFERERTSPPFGHDGTHDLLSFAGLQVALRIPIEYDDNMIGHRQFRPASNCRPRICRCAYRRRPHTRPSAPHRGRACRFDRADMDEHIGAAGVGLNEPEAFRCIEPFDCARGHVALLSDQAMNLAQPPFIARRSHRRSAAGTVVTQRER